MKKLKFFLTFFIMGIFLCIVPSVNAAQPPNELWDANAGPISVWVDFLNGYAKCYSYPGFNDQVCAAHFKITFSVDGVSYTKRAYCSDHSQAIPQNSPLDKVVERAKLLGPGDPEYNKRIAMAVYYGYEGPADLTSGLDEEHRVAITAYACNYAKNGDGDAVGLANACPQFAAIKEHIDKCDGPDNIMYVYCRTYEYKYIWLNNRWETCHPTNNSSPLGGQCTDYQHLSAFWGYAPMGKLSLNKTLDTYESSYATVSGAEYSVYSDEACTKKIGTLVTGSDGNTNTIEVVAGTYYVKETKAPEGCKIDETKYKAVVTSGNTTFIRSNEKVKYKIRISKNLQPINSCYGDAVLENAKYGIYTDSKCETTPIAILTTKKDGTTEVSEYLDYKIYYLKEIEAPIGTKINTNIYRLDPSNAIKEGQEYIATFDVTNEIIPTRLDIIKYRDEGEPSEGTSATGAILRLTLNSNKQETYTAIVDENGYCSFENIPYGTYTLTEDDTNSVDYLKIDEEIISMHESKETYTYKVVVSDDRLRVFLKVQKIDSDTNEEVKMTGAKFKIWNCRENKFVELMETPSGEMISEFVTNENGYFITPQSLDSGEYVIYETESPNGYYLEDEYRLPEDESKLGEGGIKVTLSTQIQVEEDNEGNLIYTAKVQDRPLKGKLEIYKTGEMLTEAIFEVDSEKDGEKVIYSEEKATPVYKLQGLEGVTYEIYAAEDIKSPDGRITYVTKGQKVQTIITNENGIATTKELYLGEYEIKEVKVPNGYTINKEIPNVTLTNDDPYERIKITKEEYTNERQKLQLTFNKIFKDVSYSNGEKLEKKALFGVYTKNEIQNYKGQAIIPSNMLMDLIWADENGDVTSTIDLPEGTYYVKELYASYPYTISTETVDFVLKYTDDLNQEFVVVEGPDFTNDYESASITLVKLSTTTMDNIILNGGKIDKTELNEEVQAILDQIKGMTKEDIKEYFEKNEVKFVAGAKYGIYTDEECTKALRIKNEETGVFEEAVIITDDTGLVELNNIPLGDYYLKEIEAPQGYELSDEIVKVTLDNTNKDTMVYQALIESDLMEQLITKIDIFTGEEIQNCVFEIRDENDNLLLKSVTDEEGKGYIPVSMFEDGKTYTYTEVEAPDIYDLNTEPHEFVAKFDEEGNWDVDEIKVENRRKESTVTFEKIDFIDSTPIPNCKFELKSLETDFKVEGVTDENGVYVFENIPYGKYTYTELEAPKEYIIDTTPHEVTIDAEEMKIQVTNEKAPDTSDIAIMAIASVAVICAVGIVFVIRRNKIMS